VELDLDAPGNPLGHTGGELCERAADEHAGVGHLQRRRVAIAPEQGAMSALERIPEQALKRGGPDGAVRGRLQDGPRGEQIGRGLHERVGDAVADLAPHVLIVQRARRAIGERLRIEDRVVGVGAQVGGEQAERAEQDQHDLRSARLESHELARARPTRVDRLVACAQARVYARCRERVT